jgi:hypothetical protein
VTGSCEQDQSKKPYYWRIWNLPPTVVIECGLKGRRKYSSLNAGYRTSGQSRNNSMFRPAKIKSSKSYLHWNNFSWTGCSEKKNTLSAGLYYSDKWGIHISWHYAIFFWVIWNVVARQYYSTYLTQQTIKTASGYSRMEADIRSYERLNRTVSIPADLLNGWRCRGRTVPRCRKRTVGCAAWRTVSCQAGGGLPAVPRAEAVASRNAAVTNTTRTCDTRAVRVTFL